MGSLFGSFCEWDFYHALQCYCCCLHDEQSAISLRFRVTSGGFVGDGYRCTKGSGSSRQTYFVLPGEFDYPPDPSVLFRISSLSRYDCIKFGGGVPTISIRNAWVVVCTGTIIGGFAVAPGDKAVANNDDAIIDPIQQVTGLCRQFYLLYSKRHQ